MNIQNGGLGACSCPASVQTELLTSVCLVSNSASVEKSCGRKNLFIRKPTVLTALVTETRNSLIFWRNYDQLTALTFFSVKNYNGTVNSQGPIRGFLCMKSGLSVALNLQLHFKLHLYYSLIEVFIRFPTNSTFSCYTVSIIIITIYTFLQLRLCNMFQSNQIF